MAWRMALGSMKRTSSWTTWNSSTSWQPRARKNSTRRWTSSSGALAPDEIPTTRRPPTPAPPAPAAAQPRPLGLGDVVEEVRVGPELARDLHEPVGVRRVLGADHQHEVALVGHLLDRRLTVGRGVADVVGARPGDRGELLAQPVDDRAGLVDRQRRLRDVGDLVGIVDVERVDV